MLDVAVWGQVFWKLIFRAGLQVMATTKIGVAKIFLALFLQIVLFRTEQSFVNIKNEFYLKCFFIVLAQWVYPKCDWLGRISDKVLIKYILDQQNLF